MTLFKHTLVEALSMVTADDSCFSCKIPYVPKQELFIARGDQSYLFEASVSSSLLLELDSDGFLVNERDEPVTLLTIGYDSLKNRGFQKEDFADITTFITVLDLVVENFSALSSQRIWEGDVSHVCREPLHLSFDTE